MTHPTRRRQATAAGIAAGLLAATAGGSIASGSAPNPRAEGRSQQASQEPPILPLPDPDSFMRRINNPYLPWLKGSRWVYAEYGPDGEERIDVKVLDRTKRIEGIRATVVLDLVTLDGELIEKTFDWYAQDYRGNVWYLGEATKSYDDGQVSTEGSWQAGVDGAKAGIAMPGTPRVRKLYWQEYYQGHAEDQGEVLDRSTRAAVPTGHYRHVLMTSDTTPLDRDIQEYKFYAPGVGAVLEVNVSPEQGRAELVHFSGSGR